MRFISGSLRIGSGLPEILREMVENFIFFGKKKTKRKKSIAFYQHIV